MRAFLCFATVGIVAWTANGYAQDTKKKAAEPDITKATYMVQGMH